jgi:hypothetical protein
MKLVRKIAVRIAELVGRFASTGSKEWACALESEVLHIKGDWRALGWSLSGVRILFSVRPRALSTMTELNTEAEKHAERRRHAMNNGWLATNLGLLPIIITAVQSAAQIALRRDVYSYATQLLGLLLLMPWLYVRTREPNVPDSDDHAGIVQFYVAELSALARTSALFGLFAGGLVLTTLGLEMRATSLWE